MKNFLRFAAFALSSLSVAAAESPQPLGPQPDAAAPATATPAPAPDLENHTDLEAFVDGIVRTGMEEHHVAGGVVAVVKDGRVLFSKGYGYSNIEKGAPVDPRTTLFRIGSTTKLFTWTAVMQLVEQGKLDLDADINTYLKTFQIPAAYGKPITLRNLMTHTAGFEEGFLGYLLSDDPAKQQPIAEALKQHMAARVRPPGEMSAYSNYGAALAGLIVEQVSGEPFNEYIAKHILVPLDMQFATMQEPVPERLSPYVGTGYKGENGAPVAQKYEIIGGFRPAGSGAVSALDMTHFMIAHMQDGRYGDQAILTPATAKRMHTTAFQLDPRFPGMALGFYHSRINGLDAIGHGGDTNYCHTELLLVPSKQVGLFTSFYTEDNRIREKVTEAFFDRYFPDASADASANASAAPVAGAVEAAQRYAGPYQFTRRNFSKLEKLLGLFTQMAVAPLPNGNLVVAGLGPEPTQFRPVGPNLYNRIGSKWQIAFRSDSAGNPTHMFFDFLPFMPTERVPWYERSGLWYTALGVSFLLFIGQLLRAYFRRADIKASPAPARRAEWVATGVSGWAVLTVAGIGTAVAVAGFDNILYAIPTSVKLALVLPLVFVALTALILYTTVGVWKARLWTTARRVVFSLVALAATVLSIFFWQWNVLGWQFG
ncbi:MAG: serine hydrolase domain-containing protein [Gammaproteobacteria bacterium]